MDIPTDVKGRFVIITLLNSHRIFGWVKCIAEGIIVLQTNRFGKISLSNVSNIEIVKDADIQQTKEDFIGSNSNKSA